MSTKQGRARPAARRGSESARLGLSTEPGWPGSRTRAREPPPTGRHGASAIQTLALVYLLVYNT